MNPTLLRAGAYAAALLAIGSSATFAVLSIQTDTPLRPPEPLRLSEAGLIGPVPTEAVDSDQDGLSDLEENYVWGSDPQNVSTVGLGVPDGWLVRHGFDPTGAALAGWTLSLPADLPSALASQDLRVGLAELYAFNRPPSWSEARDGPWTGGLSPHDATTPDGLSVAWLLRQGLDPREAGVGARRLADDAQTVADSYRQGTDPRRVDTDDDGLADADEATRYGTDPLRASTRGDGIPDGWIVRWGLDPTDPSVSSATFDGKGMTVQDVFRYNDGRVGRAANLAGGGLNPQVRCHQACDVPDGWMVEAGLDPLKPSASSVVLRRASESAEVRFLRTGAWSLPAIPEYVLTVREAYRYDRPASWDEARLGPWRGGLDPRTADPDGDGLDDVVEIRGWYINRTLGAGPQSLTGALHVGSDPKVRDTDGDGLDDAEEYFGRKMVGSVQRRFAPSNPKNADTAFSGLTDGEKVVGVPHGTGTFRFVSRDSDGQERALLEPNRTDSDQDGLRDGDEFALWVGRSLNPAGPYQARFPHAAFDTDLQWIARLPWVQAQATAPDAAFAAKILAPDGDADADGLPNLLDPDSDNDGLLDGWEAAPHLFAFTDFASPFPRPVIDPANSDTDGDQLPDAWELRFGEFQATSGLWTLDPSRQRSDGITPDGDANLDGDTVEWFLFQPVDGRLQPRLQAFAFTNLREFQAGTDPRTADQNGDGVPEGWAFFWGTVYPTQVLGGRAGVLVPSPAQLTQQSGKFTVTNPDLGRATKVPSGEPYHRFEPQAPVVLDANLAERVVATHTPDRAGERLTISQVEGRFALPFSTEVELRTNPYLLDTDGDVMPDAWEALRRACVDPVAPDDHLDADRDGRSNRAEYELPRNAERFGTDPCRADTDLGGLEDGKEAALRRNPLNPVDDAAGTGAGDQDTDRDGIGDAEEILRGLDPLSTDTDRDGLLDGGNLEFIVRPGEAVPSLLGELVGQGAVRVQHAIEDGVRFVVRGEAFVGTDPLLASTAGDGIPDGWKVGYGLSATSPLPQFAAKYAAAKPPWWSETSHGVWWWGSPPHATPTGDLDLDGLDDANGEDPFPAARHGCCSPAPPPDSTRAGRDAWIAAQGYGERAGEPVSLRQAWQVADYDADGILDALDRAPTVTLVEQIEQPQGVALGSWNALLKGPTDPFWVVGRVRLDCGPAWTCVDDPPLRNRVVAVLAAGAESQGPLGVGVTGPDGRFRISACLCASHTYQIPDAGIVVRSQDEGDVQWASHATLLAVGPRELVVQTYATTATFWGDASRDASHPQFQVLRGLHNGQQRLTNSTLGSSSAALAVTVASRARLVIETVDQLPWTGTSRPVPMILRLSDATSQPIVGRHVTATLDGAAIVSPPTDETGSTSVTITVPAQRKGLLTAGASFGGDEPLYLPTEAEEATIVAQGPSDVTIDPLPASIAAGDDLVVTGLLRSASQGLAQAAVVVELVDASHPTTATGVTDEGGRFHFSIRTPTTMRGPLIVRVRFEGTSLAAPANAQSATNVLAPVHVVETATQAPLVLGEPYVVGGSLFDAEAKPLPGHALVATLGHDEMGSISGASGEFRFEFLLPATDPPGPTRLTLFHPKQDGFAESATARDLVAKSRPLVAADPGDALRNTTALVRGNVTNAAGTRLAGQPVELRWMGLAVSNAATNGAGVFAVPWHVPRNASLGTHALEVHFPGSQDQLLAPTSAMVQFSVRDQARILVEKGPAAQPRDAILLRGSIRSAAGTPLAELPVTATLEDQPLASARTRERGDWSFSFGLPANRSAGVHLVRVATSGNETIGSAHANTTVHTRALTRLLLVAPAAAGLGTDFNASVYLNETGGPPVDPAPLHWSLLQSNGSTTVSGPHGRLAVTAPHDGPVGPARLTVSYPGDAHREPSSHARTILLRDAARLEIIDAPERVEPGERLLVRARLLGPDDQPLAGELVSLVLGSSELAALVRTDEEGFVQFALNPEREGELSYGVRYAGSDALAPASATAAALVQSAPVVPTRSIAAALAIAAAVAVLLMGGFAWIRLRPLAGIRSAVWSTYRELVAHDDTSGAILLAYRKLGKSLERYGYKERTSDTPAEFLRGVLRFLPGQGGHLERLSELFNAARYGGEPLDPSSREEAQTCLRLALHDLDRLVARLRLFRMVHRRAPP